MCGFYAVEDLRKESEYRFGWDSLFEKVAQTTVKAGHHIEGTTNHLCIDQTVIEHADQMLMPLSRQERRFVLKASSFIA